MGNIKVVPMSDRMAKVLHYKWRYIGRRPYLKTTEFHKIQRFNFPEQHKLPIILVLEQHILHSIKGK